MKIKNKYYFKHESDEICYPKEYFIEDVVAEGLGEASLIEAIPDNITTNYIYCSILNIVEKSDCSKKVCEHYESKSGRGVCKNKGKLYLHGEPVTFKV